MLVSSAAAGRRSCVFPAHRLNLDMPTSYCPAETSASATARGKKTGTRHRVRDGKATLEDWRLGLDK